MILLSTSHVLRKIDPEKYDSIAKDMTEDILLHLTDKGLLENVSPDGKAVDTPFGRTVNPGHSLEAAWFLMVEGMLSGDSEILCAAKKIIDFTMPLGLDKKHGGIIAFCDALGKPPTALEWDMKLWWPQNEAIIANRMAFRIFGEQKYKEQYEELLDYAFDKFADPICGEWYGYLHYDSTPSTDLKGNIFKGPFHLPRMLMLLNQMDNGKLEDFFG